MIASDISLGKDYKSGSEYFIKEKWNLLKAIPLLDNDVYFKENKKELFEKRVKEAISVFPELNLLSAESIQKDFQVKRYEKALTIENLVYYKVGQWYLEQFKCCPKKETLDLIGHSFHYGFYLGFQIDEKDVDIIINEMSGDKDYILLKAEICSISKDELKRLCEECLTPEMTDEQIISLMSPNNEGSYILLPPSIYIIGDYIIQHGCWYKWNQLIEILFYFPFQDAFICQLRTTDDCLCALKETAGSDYKHKIVIIHLLRERFFHLLYEEYEHLNKLICNEELKKHDKERSIEATYKSWQDGIDGVIKEFFEISINELGLNEMSKWYVKKEVTYRDRPSNFIGNILWAIDKIRPLIQNALINKEMDVSSADFNTLLLFVKEASKQDMSQGYYERLIKQVVRILYSDKFIQPIKLDINGIETYRSLYICLDKSKLDGWQLACMHRINLEGYKTDYSMATKSARGDSIWLSVLSLQIENSHNNGMLREIYNWIIDRTIFDSSIYADNYFSPLYIADLIVNQVLTEEKDAFEMAVIKNIPQLTLVIRLIAENNGEMSETNISLLKHRIGKEWNIERMLLDKNNKKQNDFLEKYVQEILAK